MNITEKRIAREEKGIEILIKNKKDLIDRGIYPERYKKPISLQFELTSKCNLKCKHCYNRSGQNNIEDKVTPQKWIEFSKFLVNNGGLLQATISGGEPLLLGNNLWKILDILHQDGTIFNLISNGFLFNSDSLKRIKKYRFYWIQISIDNYLSKYHDEFRGIKGSWKRAAEAAYKIALSGIPLRIASTITPRDLGNLEKFIKMAINLGASYYVIGEVMPSGRAFDNENILLNNDERNKFYLEIDELSKKYKKELSILVSGNQKIQLKYVSSGSLDGAIIRPDGTIRLDCSCPFVIGNILTDDIYKVWNDKFDCWKNEQVDKYISSCDIFNGKSSYIENYNQPDIYI